jgi:DMSO/TMAO reductase YedYZ molybdopterin-dependent catalytic subunit
MAVCNDPIDVSRPARKSDHLSLRRTLGDERSLGGFPPKKLLLAVEPKSTAKYVRFVSAVKKEECRVSRKRCTWPTIGSSTDEAMTISRSS